MSHATTARELFEDLQALPATERGKFFLLLESRAFQTEDFTYEDVFGHLAGETFTVAVAAEYLEMSVPNFRRYVRRGQITPAQTVGRNQLFGTTRFKGVQARLKRPARALNPRRTAGARLKPQTNRRRAIRPNGVERRAPKAKPGNQV